MQIFQREVESLENLKSLYFELGCDAIYAKKLSENDNSKQQIYLGPNFQSINVIPKGPIYSDQSGPRKLNTYKADLSLFWLNEYSRPEPALKAKLIWYPKYPEVRLSGFLAGCKAAPSDQMNAQNRIKGRVLFFGINSIESIVVCYLARPGSPIAKEIESTKFEAVGQVLINILLPGEIDSEEELLLRLKAINLEGPVSGRRLDKFGKVVSYKAQNAGGLTLEAMMEISANSRSEPDFLGWELKHFTTSDFKKTRGKKITLFTSEPDLGVYHDDFNKFMRVYGKSNASNRRYDFTGQHIAKLVSTTSCLRMMIEGFNFERNELTDEPGRVILLDNKDQIAGGWSFSRLLDHWERKHEKACYVPTIKGESNTYHFGPNIILGKGTSFRHFINALNYGIVQYDPGNKLIVKDNGFEGKRRNQFRFSSSFLGGLYNEIEEVDLTKVE